MVKLESFEIKILEQIKSNRHQTFSGEYLTATAKNLISSRILNIPAISATSNMYRVIITKNP